MRFASSRAGRGRSPAPCLACLLVPLLLLLWGQAGCAQPTAESAAGPDKVEIEFWEITYNTDEVIAPIVARFEAEHPHIKVKLRRLGWNNAEQQILVSLAAGLPPDVCELGNSWVPRYASEGVLLDLAESTAAIRDDYLMWEPGLLNGGVYALPWLVGTRLLFVNEDLLEQVGYEPGWVPETWEEMLAAAQRIDAINEEIFGLGMQAGDPYSPWQRFFPFAASNGASAMNADASEVTLNGPRMVEALRFYAQLADHALVDKSAEVDRAFGEGRVGMVVSGPWLFRYLPLRHPEMRFKPCLIPRSTLHADGGHRSFLGAQMLVVFKHSKHPREAELFARYMVEARNALEVALSQRNVMPAALAGYEDPALKEDPMFQVLAAQARLAIPAPQHRRWGAFERVLSAMIEEILLLGERDMPALAQRYQEHLELRLTE